MGRFNLPSDWHKVYLSLLEDQIKRGREPDFARIGASGVKDYENAMAVGNFKRAAAYARWTRWCIDA